MRCAIFSDTSSFFEATTVAAGSPLAISFAEDSGLLLLFEDYPYTIQKALSSSALLENFQYSLKFYIEFRKPLW